MAQTSVEELYHSEGSNAKYDTGEIMRAVIKEILTRGVPEANDEQTWIEILLAYACGSGTNENEGDFISDMTDTEPPSCYAEV